MYDLRPLLRLQGADRIDEDTSRAEGEGSMAYTSPPASGSTRSRMSSVTAPGPQPRSTTVSWGRMPTCSTSHRFTSRKNPWLLNFSNPNVRSPLAGAMGLGFAAGPAGSCGRAPRWIKNVQVRKATAELSW